MFSFPFSIWVSRIFTAQFFSYTHWVSMHPINNIMFSSARNHSSFHLEIIKSTPKTLSTTYTISLVACDYTWHRTCILSWQVLTFLCVIAAVTGLTAWPRLLITHKIIITVSLLWFVVAHSTSSFLFLLVTCYLVHTTLKNTY